MILDTRRRISIVGAGPAGLALAADLESHGTSVLIYSHPAHAQHASSIIERGYLKATGTVEGYVYPQVSFDMNDVVEFSHIIILTVPSTGQETILQELRNFDVSQHTIVAIPGNLFALMARTYGVQPRYIYETNLSPYACRINGEGDLCVSGKKKLVHIAAFHDRSDFAPNDQIKDVFPSVDLKWCNNIVEVSLCNINGVFHPLMNLMNAGRIENTGGDFLLYHDGLTQCVANAIIAVDEARMKIGEAFGFQLVSTLSTSNECYGHSFTDLVDLAQLSGPHKNLKAPAVLADRNITEDVPNLLVTWHDLAERLGIDASPIKAVILLAGMATGTDYTKTGRSLTNLNLDHVSKSELLRMFGVR